MIFDLSPYLSLDAFIALAIVALIAIACVGDARGNCKR